MIIQLHLLYEKKHIYLSENKSRSLEGDIKYSDLTEALKNMRKSITPENDWFPAQCFMLFWIALKMFILRTLEIMDIQ